YDLSGVFRRLADEFDPLAQAAGSGMRSINTENVDPFADHGLQHLIGRARRADCGNDFGFLFFHKFARLTYVIPAEQRESRNPEHLTSFASRTSVSAGFSKNNKTVSAV